MAVAGGACSLERASWLATRSRPAWSFGIAVLTMVLGSPIANPNTYAQLLAILAPAGTRDALVGITRRRQPAPLACPM